jgi:LPS-assembly protein
MIVCINALGKTMTYAREHTAGVLLGLTLLFLISLASLASSSFDDPLPQIPTSSRYKDLVVNADAQERLEDRIIAKGRVDVHYKNIILYADFIELDTKTKDVLAEGHVTLQLPTEVITAERLAYNLDTGQGRIEKVFGLVEPTLRYESSFVERKTDVLYSFGRSEFTMCSQPVPRWDFSCARANFKKDDYIEMWGAVLRIKNIPVFYMPYFRYPLNRERSTGFLTPQVGYSQTKGLTFSESFYWAAARNMDATFSLDYYADKGIGGGLEYRYLFADGTRGQANLYYFIFNKKAGLVPANPYPNTSSTPGTSTASTLENAYIIRLNHTQLLPGGFNLVAAINTQNSFYFLREFDNDFKRALIFTRSSQVYVSKYWSSYSFSLRTSRFETFFQQYLNQSYIISYTPQISFDSFKTKILSPFYFSFSSGFTNYQYGSDSQFKEGTQLNSQQLFFTPTLSMPFNSIPWLMVDFSLDGSLNYYWQSYSPSTYRIVNEPVLTTQYAVTIDIIGPVFYRIWDLGKTSRLKHIFEPMLTYRYESPIPEFQRLPNPFPRNHEVLYGFTNHILFKKGDMPREILTWGMSQGYILLPPEESPYRFYIDPKTGVIPRYTDVDTYLRFYPASGFSFDFAATYNTFKRSVATIRLGANLGTMANDVFLNVNWFKSVNPWYPGTIYDRHEISLFGGAKIPGLNLDALSEVNFNIGERKLLYASASLVYHYQCLDFKGDLRVFNYREKPEFQFRLSLGLGNIGQSVDFMGGADVR